MKRNLFSFEKNKGFYKQALHLKALEAECKYLFFI